MANCSFDRSRDSVPAEFGILHNSFQFQSPADLEADYMKKRLDPGRVSENRTTKPSGLSLSVTEPWSRGQQGETRFPPTLSLPLHSSNRTPLDSPGRWTDTPLYSAVSPRSFPFPQSPREQRSPRDGSDIERSPQLRTRRNNSDDATSNQGSYVGHSADEMDIDDNNSLKRLRINDGYAAASQKRRAPSPRDDEPLHGFASQSSSHLGDGYSTRGLPTPRLSTGRTEPLTSALAAPSAHPYASVSPSAIPAGLPLSNAFGRRSPGGLSPNGLSPTSTQSPYTPSASADPSPRSTTARSLPHGRNISGSSPRKIIEAAKPGGSKMSGFHMCECCPKKPKKFETVAELQ